MRELEKYDLVLVASRRHAEWLAGGDSDAGRLHATGNRSPQIPSGRARPEAGRRGRFPGQQQRPETPCGRLGDRPGASAGGVWRWLDRSHPTRYLKGDLFPNEDLAGLYASAKVVLNDHWPDMRDLGFVSNRIFDVFAAGGIVISDPVAGLDELFGDLVPVYSDPEQLEKTVRALVSDDDRRKAISHEAQTLVAGEHTFSHRAGQIMDLIQPLFASRQLDLEAGQFGDDVGEGAEGSEPRASPALDRRATRTNLNPCAQDISMICRYPN